MRRLSQPVLPAMIIKLIVASLAALAGCGGTSIVQPPPQPGILTVHWTPAATPDLAPVTGSLYFEEVWALGDAAVDAQREEIRDFYVALDQPTDLAFSNLPQGLYSRYRSEFRGITLNGSYQGTPLTIQVMLDDLFVDLRADTGIEIALGSSGRFLVGFDVGEWFAPGDLDNAVVTDGTILFDSSHNRDTLVALLQRVPTCFTLATEVTTP